MKLPACWKPFLFCGRPPSRNCFDRKWSRRRLCSDGGSSRANPPATDRNVRMTTINGEVYPIDGWTNVTEKVLSLTGRNLHLQEHHPLCLVKRRIINYFYGRFRNSRGNPLFSVHERLCPVVTVRQNFDSLLIPADHPSRRKSDTYYVNAGHLLRAHTSAHQADLILAGLDNFLVVGDVYRRDDIDASHYPVFHQMEGVRLCHRQELEQRPDVVGEFRLFEHGVRTESKQAAHAAEAVTLMQGEMQRCIEGLARTLFGAEVKWRWTDTYFPFTHPSWELEIFYNEDWLEVLGCGIVEQKLLENAGATDKIGWAFGIGLERLAMKLFEIPDVRLFWSTDSGFLSQFETDDVDAAIVYKPISIYPQCVNDLAFWIPDGFVSSDFLDIARSVGGDIVERVTLVDEFFHPKKKQWSHCYRIVYRHMERTLTQKEANETHKEIEKAAEEQLNIVVR